jgi:hypothetical protein
MPEDINKILGDADAALKSKKVQDTNKYPHCNGAYEGLLPEIGDHLQQDYTNAQKLLDKLNKENPDKKELIKAVQKYMDLKLDEAKGILILQRGLEVNGEGEKKNPLSFTFSDGTTYTTNNWTHKDMSLTAKMQEFVDEVSVYKKNVNKQLQKLGVQGFDLASVEVESNKNFYADLGRNLKFENQDADVSLTGNAATRTKKSYLAV